MNNFLKNRKSIRDFKNKRIDKKVFQEIKDYCDELEKRDDQNGFEFILYEDGEKIFKALDGVGGYGGVMIESPHYIGLNIKDDKDQSIIYGAYYMEKLITKLTYLNIGSCWISIVNVDEKTEKDVLGVEKGSMDYILAIGYPMPRNPFAEKTFSSRVAIEEIVFKDEIGKAIDVHELENRGLDDLFYYIRFAPSTYNRQPWRFILKDHRVILLMAYSKDEELILADAGIIMYYFVKLARAINIDNEWELLDGDTFEYENYKYKYIAEFSM